MRSRYGVLVKPPLNLENRQAALAPTPIAVHHRHRCGSGGSVGPPPFGRKAGARKPQQDVDDVGAEHWQELEAVAAAARGQEQARSVGVVGYDEVACRSGICQGQHAKEGREREGEGKDTGEGGKRGGGAAGR